MKPILSVKRCIKSPRPSVSVIFVCVCVCLCWTHRSPDANLPGRTLGQLATPHSRRFAGWVAEVLAQLFLSGSPAAGHLSVPHPLPTSHQALGEEGGCRMMVEKR